MMIHLLDNPIYHALTSNHLNFSEGNESVKFYKRNIAAFAGMNNYDLESFNTLDKISRNEDLFIVFSPKPLNISQPWKLVRKVDMFQFVYEHDFVPKGKDGINYKDLDESDINEMIALVALTQPGPFLERTIDLNNYIGVFEDGKLVAMTGHRFNPKNYIEVSAVCTHPDYLGKGYAFALIREQIKRILEKSQIPFLHVRNDNIGAIKLYEKLGFKIRSSMIAYVINKTT